MDDVTSVRLDRIYRKLLDALTYTSNSDQDIQLISDAVNEALALISSTCLRCGAVNKEIFCEDCR